MGSTLNKGRENMADRKAYIRKISVLEPRPPHEANTSLKAPVHLHHISSMMEGEVMQAPVFIRLDAKSRAIAR